MKNNQKDDLLISELFDAQPESVVWLEAVENGNENSSKNALDFEVSYCNNAACKFLNASKEVLIGQRLLSNTVLDNASTALIFEQSVQVYKGTSPLEFTYYNQHLNKYLNVSRSKVKNGVLTVTRDITDQYLLQKRLKQQANKFDSVTNTSGDGIIIFESIRDENDAIVDFSITHTNAVGARLGSIPPDAKGKTLLEILPHLKQSEQFTLHKQVVETGVPVQFETTFRNEKGEEYGWFIVSLLKLEDGVLSRFVDISEKKKYEEKILNQAQFLDSVLQASVNGVVVCEAIRDVQGKILDLKIVKINQGFTTLTAKKAEEVEGFTFLQLFPTTKKMGLFDLKCRVIETGEPVRKDVYYKGEGLDAWFDISMVKLGENGLTITFNNISETRKAMIELEEQRNLLNNILRHSPSGITVTEVLRNENGEIIEGQTILANESATKFTGITEEIYLTRRLSEIDPNIINSSLFRMAVTTLESGQPYLNQYLLEHYGRWLELGVSKIDDNRLVNVFTDITQIKESQIKLEKLVEELKRSNAQLSEFTYAASHDLKEPIRKINIFINQLKHTYSSVDNIEGLRIWEKLEGATERLQLLINNLLQYSDVSGPMLEFEDIDLNEKIQNVLEELDVSIEDKRAKITVEELPVIRGYGRQLQQLFQNLLENGLKYGQPGVAPEINISCRVVLGADIELDLTDEQRNKIFYLVAITDNGIGFEQKHAQNIFDMFRRLHSKKEYPGTGVGLSIARKVVENHHGYITAKSENGRGAQFKVYLPKFQK